MDRLSAVLGDGGIYSWIDDLAKWDAALFTDERLRPAFEPATPTNDPDVRYGFGWRITGDSLCTPEKPAASATRSCAIPRDG